MSGVTNLHLKINEITTDPKDENLEHLLNFRLLEKDGIKILEKRVKVSFSEGHGPLKIECCISEEIVLQPHELIIPPLGTEEIKEYEWTHSGKKIKVMMSLKWVKKWTIFRRSKTRQVSRGPQVPPDFEATLRKLLTSKNVEGIRDIMKSTYFEIIKNQKIDHQGNTLLHLICFESLPANLLEDLLKCNVDVKIPNKAENTALHYLCSNWPYPEVEILDSFVSLGADVNALNKSLETPLFKAMFNRNVRKPIVKRLLQNRADPNLLNSYNEGILHYVVRKSNEDILKLILTRCKNTSLKQKGKEGLTPKEIALVEGNKHKERAKEFNRIYKTLCNVEELDEFLQNHELTDYREYFIEEGLDLDELSCWTSEQLEGLEMKLGHFTKLVRALQERKAKKTDEEKAKLDMIQQLEIPVMNDEFLEDLKASLSQVPFIEYDQLEFLDKIGQGAYGAVWKGELRKIRGEWGIQVAIKKLMSDTPEDSLEEFKKEVTILQSISHPNVVKLYGVALKPTLMLVMEYCALGTLHHVISKLDQPFMWDKFFSISLQTCKGLDALHNHNPKILHRDIKPQNLLLTDKWQVKVADFGLSLDNSARTDALIQPSGTSAYMAPELCRSIKYSTKSDVYSFGIVLWEMIYRTIYQKHVRPYADANFSGPTADLLLILAVSTDNLRPKIPEKTPLLLHNLLTVCIDSDPSHRPEFEKVLEVLGQAFEDYNNNTNHWNNLCATPATATAATVSTAAASTVTATQNHS